MKIYCWLLPALLAAADWPQWRGPASLGVSPEPTLPTTWSPKTNLAFRAELAGSGASSPIVIQNLVVVTSQAGAYETGDGSDPRLARDERALASRERAISVRPAPELTLHVEAFHAATGKRVWLYKLPANPSRPELHEKHNLATPTPVSDGKRIFAWFGNGQLVALDLQGRELWRKDLGPFRNQWGHGSSPALYQNLLILLCDHRPGAYLLALDAATGAQKWRVDCGAGRVSHSTPVVIPTPAGDQLLINSEERIDVYRPTDGKLLWWAGASRQTPIPSAVYDKDTIYLSRGYRNSDILALKPGGAGDVSETNLKWRLPNGGSYVPSILLYEGLLYMTNEVGVVTCADAATGAVLWRERLGGIFFASPVAAAGHVYLLSESGETFVLRAGRKPDIVARNELPGRFLASPAIAGGRLYLRADDVLYAVGPGVHASQK